MRHLVIDARTALPQTDGLGTYLRQIVPTISRIGLEENRFRSTILVSPSMESFWKAATPEAAVIPSVVRPMRPQQNWQLPRQLEPLRPDLFFYPAHDPPLFLRMPFVFTVHDVTLFRIRPYFESLDRVKLAYLKVVTPTALRRARAVFAVSQETRREIGKLFGASLLPKVHVTLNGMSPPVAPAGAAPPRDSFLYVGTDRPHKNLQRVLRAYALAHGEQPALPPLEIVGGLRTPALLEAIVRDAGLESKVRFRGHVSDVELEDCYARAIAVVFPSVAEGFGLPILEGMARGVPVLTSNISACAEIAGDAALTVDPFDIRSIADGMKTLAVDADRRSDLARRGREHVRAFTWTRTAEQTLTVLRDCLR